jgi:putative hydrolase of the HAD superfamily
VTVSTPITAVLWDFGGVILSSPFEAFNRFENDRGLPPDIIRKLNSTHPDSNAWAQFERNEISAHEFDSVFAAEASALGYEIRGSEVLGLLRGDIRPEMVQALDLVRAAGYKTACLTNNMSGGDGLTARPSSEREREIDLIMEKFGAVVESSKVGCRKPETRFYEMACELLEVEPVQCVFLDDLGVNLKPAAAMGMATIKVLSADQALRDLENVLNMPLR